ncbi:MAG: PhoH family protein [Prevotellaceae bacterium]|jgi:PhoH-like ATPase|nr:PhoH family protein [Prevotellaceae bacterium]
MEKLPKIFVFDTNVILHDHHSIYNFQENDIIIPIVVLEELDKFKKGNDQINYNAREFVRELDKLSGSLLFEKGVSLGKGRGTLKIELGHPLSDTIAESFYEDSPDHRILAIASWVKSRHPERPVILVTKDINLRIKAKALMLPAQDYLTDRVKDDHIDLLRKGVEWVHASNTMIAKLFQHPDGAFPKDIKIKKPYPNQNFLLKNRNGNIPARYDPVKRRIVPIERHRTYGIEARNDEQSFALDILRNPQISLVSLTGIAGTGKTLLALAAALAQEQNYKQILLSRPVIPLQNQDLGFLPGDIKEKLAPYMLPLFDNLSVIKNAFKPTSREAFRIDEMLKTEKLLISPLAYIRGRSLSDTFFIIDESQNLTPHEVKTIITRAGEGTKLVFTGDIHQIDSPYLDMHSNGLTHLTDKMLGQDVFAHVNLVKGERSKLAELAGNIL